MGNDVPCKAIDIGSVQIKMHDGVVKTLIEVRHVLNLKKNMISLGIMNDKGYKFSCEDGILKVIKGSLVVMKGVKERTLFILQ